MWRPHAAGWAQVPIALDNIGTNLLPASFFPIGRDFFSPAYPLGGPEAAQAPGGQGRRHSESSSVVSVVRSCLVKRDSAGENGCDEVDLPQGRPACARRRRKIVRRDDVAAPVDSNFSFLLRQTRQPLFKTCGASLKTAILSQRIKQFRGFRNLFVLDLFLNLNGPPADIWSSIVFSRIRTNTLVALELLPLGLVEMGEHNALVGQRAEVLAPA